MFVGVASSASNTLSVGSLAMLRDHVNLSGANPLNGANVDRFGTRFPDMGDTYTADLRSRMLTVAENIGLKLPEVVALQVRNIYI